MSSEEAADDFSGLSGFFFYVFIVHPATAWILRPGRFERRKSIIYAIAFLAAIAAIKTGKNIISSLFQVNKVYIFSSLRDCLVCVKFFDQYRRNLLKCYLN